MTQITPITLPKWGLEMSEGTVTGWHLKPGDSAEKGAELVDVETDKIVNCVELDAPGTLRRILVDEGEVAPVGALIAVMADESVEEAAIDAFVAEFKPVDASFEPSEGEDKPAKAEAAPTPEAPKSEVKATPLARRTAEQSGVDLSAVQGSGHKGKVMRDDVAKAGSSSGVSKKSAEEVRAENAGVHASPIAVKFANEVGLGLSGLKGTGRKGRVSLGDAEEAAIAAGIWSRPAKVARGVVDVAGPASGSEQPFTGMRKSIARALVHSKQTVPHFYTTVDLRVDALMDLRKGMNAAGEGAKISVNDFLIRACGVALGQHPGVNVHVSDVGVTLFDSADVSVAVAIEGGLITPVLRDVGNRGLRDIAAGAADLAARARSRELTAEELKGGTFTLSNLGMFGVREFDAIINPPQGAILAVGGPRREAVELPDGGVGFATMTSATLSADHRAIDGALAAQFLATLKGLVEDPMRLLQ
ncbi:2-oxo acid dehydrogenase subunit E2 [Maritimibacter sp. DP1N21-5]|uniref:2-oxo acid dehydrogenase subunit E2 n=1 Tax=Maritimibacter sp. DP1N21-5 TaxID=2836867 RepID=UPI001C455B64|nr:2-oxo acid dehydrogenase subunit E2 [Maritimibacter sp. DP1N21-5]MBV7407365.1 2-oxo acid dehydrogenase subunit E2 [Maritimibacter sp. DP1N21-5]